MGKIRPAQPIRKSLVSKGLGEHHGTPVCQENLRDREEIKISIKSSLTSFLSITFSILFALLAFYFSKASSTCVTW